MKIQLKIYNNRTTVAELLHAFKKIIADAESMDSTIMDKRVTVMTPDKYSQAESNCGFINLEIS